MPKPTSVCPGCSDSPHPTPAQEQVCPCTCWVLHHQLCPLRGVQGTWKRYRTGRPSSSCLFTDTSVPKSAINIPFLISGPTYSRPLPEGSMAPSSLHSFHTTDVYESLFPAMQQATQELPGLWGDRHRCGGCRAQKQAPSGGCPTNGNSRAEFGREGPADVRWR